MDIEEATDILKNIIADEVIGTYCIEIQKEGINCSENCKDEDCYLIQAIETVLNELDNKDDDIDILLNRIDEYEKNTMWKYDVKEALDKKDKIINEMAEVLNDFDYDKQCEICHTDICSASEDRTEYTKCIIDYFTKKVEGK